MTILGATPTTKFVSFLLLSLFLHFAQQRQTPKYNEDLLCKVPTGLKFCSQVNYNVSLLYVKDFTQADREAKAEFDKYKDHIQIQSVECMESFKNHICAAKLPICPYCPDYNIFCRNGCVEYMSACARSPGDSQLVCFAGNIFTNTTTCTPEPHTASYFKCRVPTGLQTCASVVNYAVPSAASDNGASQVWSTMDGITGRRYSSFVRAPGVTETCKQLILKNLCTVGFTPCVQGAAEQPWDPTKVLDTRAALRFTCEDMQKECPEGVYKKLCSFDYPAPPDPSQCTPPPAAAPHLHMKKLRF